MVTTGHGSRRANVRDALVANATSQVGLKDDLFHRWESVWWLYSRMSGGIRECLLFLRVICYRLNPLLHSLPTHQSSVALGVQHSETLQTDAYEYTFVDVRVHRRKMNISDHIYRTSVWVRSQCLYIYWHTPPSVIPDCYLEFLFHSTHSLTRRQ